MDFDLFGWTGRIAIHLQCNCVFPTLKLACIKLPFAIRERLKMAARSPEIQSGTGDWLVRFLCSNFALENTLVKQPDYPGGVGRLLSNQAFRDITLRGELN